MSESKFYAVLFEKIKRRGPSRFLVLIFNQFELYSKTIIPDDKKFDRLNKWISGIKNE